MDGCKTWPENFKNRSEMAHLRKMLLSCSGLGAADSWVAWAGALDHAGDVCVHGWRGFLHLNSTIKKCAFHKCPSLKQWILCSQDLFWFHLYSCSQSGARYWVSHNSDTCVPRSIQAIAGEDENPFPFNCKTVQCWFLFCSALLGTFLSIMTSVSEIAYISHNRVLLLNLALTE